MPDDPATIRSPFFPAWLTARRGGPLIRFYLRLAGALALLGIVVLLLLPSLANLVPFVALALWYNGPTSPVVPGGFEPVLLLYGQLYPPVVVAALGTVANVVIEAVNYHIFAAAAESHAMRKVHDSRLVTWLTHAFHRSPFLAVAVCAAAFPLWIARVLVVLARYPLPRHLAATAVGRFPRFWVLAAVGASIGIPPRWLAVFVVVSLILTATVVSVKWIRSRTRGAPAFDVGGAVSGNAAADDSSDADKALTRMCCHG